MKRFLFALALMAMSSGPTLALDYSAQSSEQLIDELTALDAQAPGIDDSGVYDAFMAEDIMPEFRGGLLPVDTPSIPPQMRELVRRGVIALPDLIAHLNDKRPTKLLVGGIDPMETVGGQFYADEYDARDLQAKVSSCSMTNSCRSFDHKYSVKIGDICEVLVGQIVNRKLLAVRYQPTAILYVNSPIESPSLVERIRKEWNGLDAKAHEASLLSDLRESDDDISSWRSYRDALVRLRFYYPKTYAALSGKDLVKRNAFETEEKEQKARESARR